MNDDMNDYLWDRTGEPDPEIQQLEEVLGTLRYQPRPLEIPADVVPGRKRFDFLAVGSSLAPRLAIAAAIALVVLGLGLWLTLQRQHAPELAVGKGTPATTVATSQAAVVAPNAVELKAVTSNKAGNDSAPAKISRQVKVHRHMNAGVANRDTTAANTNRNRSPVRANSELAAGEIKEAEAAKQQLMLALRLASSKLSFAQRKTRGSNPENQIHNQHKIG